ncbi:hypothetical protein LINPERPRIM_LOCUS22130 [Linum perenne]
MESQYWKEKKVSLCLVEKEIGSYLCFECRFLTEMLLEVSPGDA